MFPEAPSSAPVPQLDLTGAAVRWDSPVCSDIVLPEDSELSLQTRDVAGDTSFPDTWGNRLRRVSPAPGHTVISGMLSWGQALVSEPTDPFPAHWALGESGGRGEPPPQRHPRQGQGKPSWCRVCRSESRHGDKENPGWHSCPAGQPAFSSPLCLLSLRHPLHHEGFPWPSLGVPVEAGPLSHVTHPEPSEEGKGQWAQRPGPGPSSAFH